MQTRKDSLKESFFNIAIGLFVAFFSQLAVFPLVGIDAELSQNIQVSVYFTIISLARSYLIRRWFNKR